MGDPTLLILLVFAAGMMWWMSSRSKKQRQAAESFRDSLAPGQEVMTGSGLFGTIVAVDDDRITLVSGEGGSTSVWLRAAIAKLVEPPVEEDEVVIDEDLVPDDASSLDPEPDAEPVPDAEPTVTVVEDDEADVADDGKPGKENPYT